MWSQKAGNKIDEDSDEDSEEDSDEDSSDEEESTAEASREDRKAQKKARKEAAIAKSQSKTVEVGDLPSSDEESDDDMPANPNHSKAARKQTDRTPVEEITEGVAKMQAPGNRKEREALEAQVAKEKYMKLQAEGKTDQAKADLARLKLIREQRAAEASRRQVSYIPQRLLLCIYAFLVRPIRTRGCTTPHWTVSAANIPRQAEKEEKDAQDKARAAEIEAREAKLRAAAAAPKKVSKKK